MACGSFCILGVVITRGHPRALVLMFIRPTSLIRQTKTFRRLGDRGFCGVHVAFFKAVLFDNVIFVTTCHKWYYMSQKRK